MRISAMGSRGKRGLFDLSIRIGSPDKPQLKVMQKASRFFHACWRMNDEIEKSINN
jgi:hypothetical protein